jgi:hypothetical protein
MPDQPASPEVVSFLRNQGFDELMRDADLAASYCRSIGEAAYRGEELTAGVHIKQLRLCCLAMIKTYKICFEGKGEGVSGEPGPSHADREDQRPGDGVARGELE